MSRNETWILRNFGKLVDRYAGHCVAVVDGKLAAVATNQMAAYKKAAQKYPGKRPSVLRIPKKRELTFISTPT